MRTEFVTGILAGWTCMHTKIYTINCVKMQTRVEKRSKKNSMIRDAQKGWKQVADVQMQCNSTSLIHVDVQLTAIGISMLLVCMWYISV